MSSLYSQENASFSNTAWLDKRLKNEQMNGGMSFFIEHFHK